jgi:hypothetical protein
MKVIEIARFRNTNHAQMRENLETFEKHGAPKGLEGLWMSADGRTVFAIYETDDPSDLQKYTVLYAPYLEQLELHLVTDASVAVPNMKEALGLVP